MGLDRPSDANFSSRATSGIEGGGVEPGSEQPKKPDWVSMDTPGSDNTAQAVIAPSDATYTPGARSGLLDQKDTFYPPRLHYESADGDPGALDTPAKTNDLPERAALSGARLLRAKFMTKSENSDKQIGEAPHNMAKVGAIREALHTDGPQILSYKKTERDSQPSIDITEGLAPVALAIIEQHVGHEEQGAPPDEKMKVWARLEGVFRVSDKANEGSAAGQEQRGIDLGALAEKGQELDAFQLVVRGSLVADDDHNRNLDIVRIKEANAQNLYLNEKQAARLGAAKSRLEEGSDTAPVTLDIVVGAPDAATLERMVQLTKRWALPTEDRTWHELKEEGKLKTFDTMQAALDTPSSPEYGDLMKAVAAAAGFRGNGEELRYDRHISAIDFQMLVQLPERDIPGLPYKHVEEYALSIDIAPGTPVVNLGDIIDSKGRRQGEALMPLEEFTGHFFLMGPSGFGKTELLRHLVLRLCQVHAELSKNPEVAPLQALAMILTDFRKDHNLAPQIADMKAALGLEQPVYDVALGSDEGAPIILPILEPTGKKTPLDIIDKLAIEFSRDLPEEVAQHLFRKYFSGALESAYSMLGWDLKTGKSRFPHGKPPVPDLDTIAFCMDWYINNQPFKFETQQEVKAWNSTEVQAKLRGVPGRLLAHGYPLQIAAIFELGAIVGIGMERIQDTAVKNLALSTLFNGVLDYLEMTNPSQRGDINRLRALLFMDEGNNIFDQDELANSQRFAEVRGKGLGLGLSAQDDAKRMSPHVNANTRITAMMNTPFVDDREVAGGKMPLTQGQKDYLAALERGEMVLYDANVTKYGPVRVRTPDPELTPRGKGKLGDLRDIIDMGNDTELYDGTTKAEANQFLKDDPLGKKISVWADFNAILVGLGRQPLELLEGGGLHRELRRMEAREPQKLHSAITQAVEKVVMARPHIMNVATYREYTGYLVRAMLAQARGEQLPDEPPRLDLALAEGYYAPVKDAILAKMIAPRLDQAKYAPFKEVLDGIAGKTAEQQMASVDSKERRTLDNLKATIVNAQLSDDVVQKARLEVAKLLGGRRLQDGLTFVKSELERRFNGKLPEQGEKNLQLITSIFSQPDEVAKDPKLEKTLAYGYQAARQALEKHEAAYQEATAGPVDLSEYEAIYEESFRADTLQGQLELVEERELQKQADSPYAIDMLDHLMAPDLLRGGFVADLLVKPSKKSLIEQAQDMEHGALTDQNTVLKTFQRGDYAGNELAGELSTVIYGDSFDMKVTTAQLLVHVFSNVIDHLGKREMKLFAGKQRG